MNSSAPHTLQCSKTTSFQRCAGLLKSCLWKELCPLHLMVYLSNTRLRTVPRAKVFTRVASPGREHCHSPFKGCWLARSHRHSRSSTVHKISVTPCFDSTLTPKEKNRRRVSGRDAPGFLSLVQGSPEQSRPGLSLELAQSCQPVAPTGRVGSNPTPGANTHSFSGYRDSPSHGKIA